MRNLTFALLLLSLTLPLFAADETPAVPKPSVLIVNGGQRVENAGDFPLLKWLNSQGLQLNMHYVEQGPLTWDLIKQYNCLAFIVLPSAAPARAQLQELLPRYLAAGGGVFFMSEQEGYAGTLHNIKNLESYLAPYGAKIPLEAPNDAATRTRHDRVGAFYMYTDKINPSPVSEGVKGLWFPASWGPNWAFHALGMPIDVSKDWQVVVRGADSSFSEPLTEVGNSAEHDLVAGMSHRADPKLPPDLYAIRPVGPGRMALVMIWPQLTLYGGNSWVHNGAVLNQGLGNRPSDFQKLLLNTFRWLGEPSLKSGQLGGYVQDPLVLVHPNLRQAPDKYYSQFDTYQNPTPPGTVFRGLIGARTSYSSGKGSVADYAAAAGRAGLSFVVFLEEFGKCSEAKYKQLEADCKKLSADQLVLIPGYALDNNIGNHMFLFGYDGKWPTPSQLDGPNKDQLRTQTKDKDGNLYYSDEDAKNLLWHYTGVVPRNIGYYDFAHSTGMPLRDLRLYGILGLVSYRDGKQIEDVTPDYLDYVMDGDPPLACAVDVVSSPAELEASVKAGHYLTNVAAGAVKDIPLALMYGHQYGRPTSTPPPAPLSTPGPGTERVMTYAGESFVTNRYRVRPLAWVTSDAGLKEIRIYCDTKLFRRLLLNGDKEFRQTFEWAYDRHRIFVLEAIDVNGKRAVSAGHEVWQDGAFNGWCGDRQNGELWHGPLTFPGARWPTFSQGPTWDGGGSESFLGLGVEMGPALITGRPKETLIEGFSRRYGGRWLEGNMWPTCYDDTTANAAMVADHEYAPGVVANAYNTLGPVVPNQYMTFTQRRTQYLARIGGPNLDSWPMYPERVGGNLAVIEGTLTLVKDVTLERHRSRRPQRPELRRRPPQRPPLGLPHRQQLRAAGRRPRLRLRPRLPLPARPGPPGDLPANPPARRLRRHVRQPPRQQQPRGQSRCAAARLHRLARAHAHALRHRRAQSRRDLLLEVPGHLRLHAAARPQPLPPGGDPGVLRPRREERLGDLGPARPVGHHLRPDRPRRHRRRGGVHRPHPRLRPGPPPPPALRRLQPQVDRRPLPVGGLLPRLLYAGQARLP